MQSDQLEALAAAVSEGTFDAAARALNVTPSAISQRIKTLENSLGRVLVERTKPVRATHDGEVLLRAQRQIDWINQETRRELAETSTPRSIPLAINADSLSTWALPVLAEQAAALNATFDITREDEGHSLDLLRTGAVLGAVTASSDNVPGCVTTALGELTYTAVATPSFIKNHFGTQASKGTLASAPVVYFDKKDRLQSLFLARFGRDLAPPRHYIPGSSAYLEAVRHGMGWGLIPGPQLAAIPAGELAPIASSARVKVKLYWTRWKVAAELLDGLGRAFAAALARG